MFSTVKRAFGVITVTESRDTITMEGLRVPALVADIMRRWGTSKIANSMFLRQSGSKVSFYRFFAIEMVFILKELAKMPRKQTRAGVILDLIRALEENTWLRDTKTNHPSVLDRSRLKNLKWKPLPEQEEFFKAYDETVTKYHLKGYMLAARAGSGKAQPLDAVIHTPNGPSTMGEMHVGKKILAYDGTVTEVTEVFPQGRIEVNRITFEDGRSTRACPDHLWRVYMKSDASENFYEPRVMRLEDVRELLQMGGYEDRLYIDMLRPYAVTEKADTRFSTLIHQARDVRTRFKEPEFDLNEVLEVSTAPGRMVFVATCLRLPFECEIAEKTITIANTATRDLMTEMVRSLGGYARTEGLKLHVKLDMRMFVQWDHIHENRVKLKISSITFDSWEEAQCISIAHKDRLYVTDDYIVTHNTFGAIALFEMLNPDVKVYVVPKNSITEVWTATHDKVYDNPDYWHSTSGKPLKPGYKVYILHYEWLEEFLRFAQGGGLGTNADVAIAVDESHNFNENGAASKRTGYLVSLARTTQAQNVVWMSGTPFKAVGSEVIPFMMCVDDFFSAPVELAVRALYGKNATRALEILSHRIGITTYIIQTEDPQTVTVKELNVKLKNAKDYELSTIRKVMEDFIRQRMEYYRKNRPELVEKYFSLIEVFKAKATPAELKDLETYQRYAKTISEGYDPVAHKDMAVFCNKFEDNVIIPKLSPEQKHLFRDVKSVYKYYQLKVQGEALGQILGRTRTQCNIDIATQGDLDMVIRGTTEKVTFADIINMSLSKTVIFTSFVPVADALAERLGGEGFRPLVIHGGTNKNLTSIIDQFRNSDAHDPLIATYQSLSTAVPLIMASNMIMLNAPFRDYTRIQAIARCKRLGQIHPVSVWDVFLDTGSEPNISTRSKDILEWSKAQIEAIMGTKLGSESVSMESLVEDGILDEITFEAPADSFALESADDLFSFQDSKMLKW